MDGWKDGWIYGQTDQNTDRQTDGSKDGGMDGQTEQYSDRRTDGRMDGQMDQTDRYIDLGLEINLNTCCHVIFQSSSSTSQLLFSESVSLFHRFSWVKTKASPQSL